MATARKCFDRVTLVIDDDAPMLAPLPLGNTLRRAGRQLGARVGSGAQPRATHTICIGGDFTASGWKIHCWWDRWLSGTRASPGDAYGDFGWPSRACSRLRSRCARSSRASSRPRCCAARCERQFVGAVERRDFPPIALLASMFRIICGFLVWPAGRGFVWSCAWLAQRADERSCRTTR